VIQRPSTARPPAHCLPASKAGWWPSSEDRRPGAGEQARGSNLRLVVKLARRWTDQGADLVQEVPGLLIRLMKNIPTHPREVSWKLRGAHAGRRTAFFKGVVGAGGLFDAVWSRRDRSASPSRSRAAGRFGAGGRAAGVQVKRSAAQLERRLGGPGRDYPERVLAPEPALQVVARRVCCRASASGRSRGR
jgi:hypothetical protein